MVRRCRAASLLCCSSAAAAAAAADAFAANAALGTLLINY